MSEPSYGSPGPAPTVNPVGSALPPPPLSPGDERTWAIVAHLSSFVAAWLVLGLVGPLLVLLFVGRRSPFVRRHAVEALNWNISALIYAAVSGILVLILVGIPMLIALGICYLVFTIMGAMAASRGEEFRYPLTIRFVK